MMPKKKFKVSSKARVFGQGIFASASVTSAQISCLFAAFLSGLLHFFSILKESLECLECLAVLAHAKLGTVIVWVPLFCSTDGTLSFSSGKM